MATSRRTKRLKRHSYVDAAPDEPIDRTTFNVRELCIAALILLVAGGGSTISQLSMSPVYGSLPASRYHNQGLVCTGLVTVSFSLNARRQIPTTLRKWLPVLAWSAIPTQHYLFRLSGYMGPVYGPLATEACTYFPLLLLSLLAAASILESYAVRNMNWSIRRSISLATSILVFSIGKKLSGEYLPLLIGGPILLTRYGLQVTTASSYLALAPGSAILPSLVPMAWVIFLDPRNSLNHVVLSFGDSLEKNKYTLLERRESLTGYISVLESEEDEFRVLRCDHSLLGGEWLVTERSRKRGLRQRETVYSVFTMLEAVRLIARQTPARDSTSSALFIGLGIGTSPKAFIEHGINTTIVELDPVVHAFASKYFELPHNHQAYLQDAVPFVDRFSASEPASYDYIIHDVFTGGAEPTALFTLEFLQGLEKLLISDGVIAINYAADLSLPVSKIIIRTILEVFPTCRIYRDTPPEEAGAGGSFINMVLFCTKSKNGRIKFRDATEADWLGSLSRRQWIPPKESLEMPINDFLTARDIQDDSMILKRGREANVEKYHHVSAERHWRIMRTVLPDAVWELW